MSTVVKSKNLNTRQSIAGFEGLYSRSNKILVKFKWDGKTHYQTTGLEVSKPNLKKCERLLADIEKQIAIGIFDFADTFPSARKSAGSTKNSQMRIIDVAAKWLDEWQLLNKKASPHTFKCYSSVIKHHVSKLNTQAMASITVGALKDWYRGLVDTRTGKPLGYKRKMNVLSVSKHIFLEAHSSGLFEDKANPFIQFESWIKSLEGKANTEAFKGIDEGDPMTQSEVDQILQWGLNHPALCYESEINMLGFNFSTGLRLGELFGLTWECIDFDARTIEVNAQISEGSFKTPKVGSYRKLELTDEAIKWLKRQRAVTFFLRQISLDFTTDAVDAGTGNLHVERKSCRFVFPNPACEFERPYMRSDCFSTRWYRILQLAGITTTIGKTKKRRTPNTMRHTFASRLLTAGAPIELVARQLGNTPSACKKHYARIIKSEQTLSNHDILNKLMNATRA